MPTHIKIMSGNFLYQKACAAGGLGAVVGTPAEVALIRMTADGR